MRFRVETVAIKHEQEFRVPDLLFRRIDGTEIVELRKRFEGL